MEKSKHFFKTNSFIYDFRKTLPSLSASFAMFHMHTFSCVSIHFI